ncbi:MAG: AtpZ/AtpI family protein [Rhodospirillaceae bacterium]|nr:AtpZ/AtpI family protein [Rhodospirillaceae bacterium]
MQDAVADKKETAKEAEESAQGVGVGFRIGMELVAGVLVGAGLGWFIDDKLNTKPIFMLALIAVGFAASVLSVLRILKGLDEAVGLGRAIRAKEGREKEARDAKTQPPPKAGDDDE